MECRTCYPCHCPLLLGSNFLISELYHRAQVGITHLAHFFATLADLEYPIPAGYRLLYTLEKHDPHRQRAVPREEIMDRVFRDGVCRLSYDPLSRLALTIQYYCGTRVSETCDLHLFCVLEDRDGHVYLLIPKGKSKEERPFPMVEMGMGPLLEYMDEVVALRLSPDGTSRTLGKGIGITCLTGPLVLEAP